MHTKESSRFKCFNHFNKTNGMEPSAPMTIGITAIGICLDDNLQVPILIKSLILYFFALTCTSPGIVTSIKYPTLSTITISGWLLQIGRSALIVKFHKFLQNELSIIGSVRLSLLFYATYIPWHTYSLEFNSNFRVKDVS